LPVIRLTIDMPRWLWRIALRCQLAIVLEVEGEILAPSDLVQHGRPLTLLYGPPDSTSRRKARSGLQPHA
jgi:hypothetical protein